MVAIVVPIFIKLPLGATGEAPTSAFIQRNRKQSLPICDSAVHNGTDRDAPSTRSWRTERGMKRSVVSSKVSAGQHVKGGHHHPRGKDASGLHQDVGPARK